MFSIYNSETFSIDSNAHYISWALESGLGFAFCHTMESLGIDFPKTMDIFVTINAKCETATMYPLANITIMPNGDYEDKVTYKHFNDALKAQNTRIRAKTVIFDMRNYCYNSIFGNAEYLEMIKHSYESMRILREKENAVENWIVLYPAKNKLPSWAIQYLNSDTDVQTD